jgi:sugar phosphate isomerase/epimerase
MACTIVQQHQHGGGPLCAGAQRASAGELAEIAGKLATAGYQGIELHPHHLAAMGEDAGLRRRLSGALEDAGLRVAAVYGGVPTDAGSVALVRARMEVAAQFGADVVFVVPPSRRRCTLSRTADRLRELCAGASELGLSLAVHNHAGTAVTTVAESLALLELVDMPSAGLCLDVAHLALFEDHLGEAIAELMPVTAYIHLKDLEGWARTRLNDLEGDTLEEVARLTPAYTDLGAGSLDLPMVVAALKRDDEIWTAIEMETLRAPSVVEQCELNAAAHRALRNKSIPGTAIR